MNGLGILCCVAFFVIVGCQAVLLNWCYSRHSNWRWLKRRYPAPPTAPAAGRQVFKDVTIRVNEHWYWRASRLTLSSAGLRMEMPAPLPRLFHQPVLVPWDDVTLQGCGADGSLLLDIGDSTKVTLTETAALGTHRFLDRRATRTLPRKLHRAASERRN